MANAGLAVAERFAEAVRARKVPEGLVADDCRIENVPTAVTDKTYVGLDGARRWMQDLLEAFDEEASFEQEVIEATDDHVVAVLRIAGRGSASGAPLELKWAAVMWVRDGQVARAAGFASRREAFAALEAAG